jgi:hypothetical protein
MSQHSPFVVSPEQQEQQLEKEKDDTKGEGHDGTASATRRPGKARGEGGTGGPGRKPRACKCGTRKEDRMIMILTMELGQECKRQKMKCESLPGDRKCRNCLRRGIECVMKYAPNPTMTEVENRYEYVHYLCYLPPDY